jgi:hypothetical protein
MASVGLALWQPKPSSHVGYDANSKHYRFGFCCYRDNGAASAKDKGLSYWKDAGSTESQGCHKAIKSAVHAASAIGRNDRRHDESDRLAAAFGTRLPVGCRPEQAYLNLISKMGMANASIAWVAARRNEPPASRVARPVECIMSCQTIDLFGPDTDSIAIEIARLSELPLNDLRARWRTVFRRPAPVHLSRQLLFRTLAYQLQAARCGDLNAECRRMLERLNTDPIKGAAQLATELERPGRTLEGGLATNRSRHLYFRQLLHDLVTPKTFHDFRRV